MNEIEKKEELERLMQKAKDFWATPFDELIEQGYGAVEVPKVTILNNTERLLRSIDK